MITKLDGFYDTIRVTLQELTTLIGLHETSDILTRLMKLLSLRDLINQDYSEGKWRQQSPSKRWYPTTSL